MKKITIYTDGCSLGNPGKGGYCGILRYEVNETLHERIVSGGVRDTTNNRMELMAVIEAVKSLKTPCDIEIYSDSTYVVRGISEWLVNWQKRNFREVKNPDLWKEYLLVSQKHKIKCIWVRGHNGNELNEKCDIIAKTEAQKI